MNIINLILTLTVGIMPSMAQAVTLQGGVETQEAQQYNLVASGSQFQAQVQQLQYNLQAIKQAPNYNLQGINNRFDMQGSIQSVNPNIYAQIPQNQHQLSAVGVYWENYIIRFIDPNSDLFGQIHPGDRIISVDGLDPNYARQIRHNFGQEQTLVTVVYLHNSEQIQASCHRHPISSFSPFMQAILSR